MAFTYFGFALAGDRARYRDGYEYCEMAFSLLKRLPPRGDRGNLLVHRALVGVWVRPIAEIIAPLHEAVRASVDDGNSMMAATASLHLVMGSFLGGLPLDRVLVEIERGLLIAAQSQYELVSGCLRPRRQLVRWLRGFLAGGRRLG